MGSPAVLALDVGGTKIAGGIVQMDADPNVLLWEERPTDAARGGEEVLKKVVRFALDLIESSPVPLRAIGVGTAGVVDVETGTITSATDLIPGWAGTQLGTALKQTTGLPVSVQGDVAAHALGEYHFGAGRHTRSCLAVGLGTGIGGAYVQDGIVLTGAHGVGGHVGHVTAPAAAGEQCSCGRTGHLEPIASGTGIAEQYNRRHLAAGETPLTGRQVDDLAEDGDSAAIEVVRTAGHALGQALGSLANTLDPEVIVLSGSVTNSGDTWWQAVRQGYEEQAMNPVLATPIVRGMLGGSAPLIGAATTAAKLAAANLAGVNTEECDRISEANK